MLASGLQLYAVWPDYTDVFNRIRSQAVRGNKILALSVWLAKSILIHVFTVYVRYFCRQTSKYMVCIYCHIHVQYVYTVIYTVCVRCALSVICHIQYVGWARTKYLYIYTVYIRYSKQGNHHTYGHIRCVYTVLANPNSMFKRYTLCLCPTSLCVCTVISVCVYDSGQFLTYSALTNLGWAEGNP